jgi:hypothetical protein
MFRVVLVAVISLTACSEGQPQYLVHPPDLGTQPPQLVGNTLPLRAGPYAYLVFTVDDADTQSPVPSRVIFRPPPGSGFADSETVGIAPDPLRSPGSFTGAVVGPGVLGSTEGVMLVDGIGAVPVPPGTYQLFITRGPEYEAVVTSVTVIDGDVKPVHAVLQRTVDTTGWLAADMHIHLARSYDSKLQPERRVISMVSNGVEVLVATDHNVNTDLGPAAASLGYGPDRVGTLVGNEFNFKEGHAGAYPVPYDAMKPAGGAPPYQPPVNGICQDPIIGVNCLTAADAFPMMRGQVPNTTVVTVNHPFWAAGDLGYFTNIQWGAGTSLPLPAALGTAGLFDAIEVLNGYQTRDAVFNNLVADWFYLLGQGYRVTALGNSDTHKIAWVRAGWPRTWLRLPNDLPGDTTGELLADAIRNQRAIASTGPFVTLTVDQAQIGDLMIPTTPGQVTVGVTVDAPDWIHVDTLRLYVNGQLTDTLTIGRGQRPLFKGTFVKTVSADSWVVAFASGEDPLPPDVVGEYAHANGFEMKPWALTNPVFIDADGDGQWHPPLPTAGAPHRLPSPQPFDAVVPQACDPSETVGSEPPLDTPEHLAMPLLY